MGGEKTPPPPLPISPHPWPFLSSLPFIPDENTGTVKNSNNIVCVCVCILPLHLQTSSTLLSTEAIKNIIQYLGLQPCERSDKVPEGKSSHTLFLAGIYRGGHDALVRAKLALDSSGVTMQLTVRSTDPSVSEVLATAIA